MRLIIPGMVAHLADVAGRVTTGAALSPVELKGVDEVLKAFNTLFSTFPEANREFVWLCSFEQVLKRHS